MPSTPASQHVASPHVAPVPAAPTNAALRTVARTGLAALAGAAVLGACHANPLTPPPASDLGLWPDAAQGVESDALADLVEEAWSKQLRAHPVWASDLGDHRYLGKLPSNSREAIDNRAAEVADLAARLRRVPVTQLSTSDRLDRDVLVAELEREGRYLDLDLQEFTLDPIWGPHQWFLQIAADQPTGDAREREQLVERWRAMATYLRRHREALLRGQARGVVAPRSAIDTVVAQVDAILDTPVHESPLVTPATGGGRWVPLEPGRTLADLAREELGDPRRALDLQRINPNVVDVPERAERVRVLIPAPDDTLSPAARGEFLATVTEVVRGEIYPSLAGLRATLAFDLSRRAREDSRAGLAWVPGGRAIYEELIEHHTTLPLSAREVHEYGLSEVARIRAEMEALGAELFGTGSLQELQARLRNDPDLFFDTREAVLAKAREALDRAEAASREFFLRAPIAASVVVEVPDNEAPHTTIAYYKGPAADGSRPGRYYVNSWEPQTRPRYDAEVLAYHEAIPGHHYQIALAQELEDLPLFRRHIGSTAFVEGWALYSERLADEMGLYSTDLDRLGMLSFDAWRACRLVVDTGLHEEGWPRERAIDYVYENTLLSRNNCENEVDRYIAWPGQALAYKIGQREILDLRAAAERQLGSRFDLATFHDQVLRNGAVPLPILREQVQAWIARVGA